MGREATRHDADRDEHGSRAAELHRIARFQVERQQRLHETRCPETSGQGYGEAGAINKPMPYDETQGGERSIYRVSALGQFTVTVIGNADASVPVLIKKRCPS